MKADSYVAVSAIKADSYVAVSAIKLSLNLSLNRM
jgi:hypothetical protein